MGILRKKDSSEPVIDDPALIAFERKIQDLYLAQPTEEVASKHISLMLAEAGASSGRSFRVPLLRRLRTSITVRIAAVTTLALGATGGLAYAGALPDAMQDAISSAAAKAGLELPLGDPDAARATQEKAEQVRSDTAKTVNDDVLDAVRSDYESGRQKGDAVSDAANQNRKNENHPSGDGIDRAATDDPPASGRPDDPQDQGPKKP